MSRIIKIELERAFRSKGLLLSLLVGFCIAIVHFILRVIPARNAGILSGFTAGITSYPTSVFNYFMMADSLSPYGTLFLNIFPILATIPFAVSYHEDRKGFVKSLYIRCEKWKYLTAKYIAVFLSGGTAVVLPILLNLILTACMLPSLVPVPNSRFIGGGDAFMKDIFYTQPYLYMLIYLIICFIYGGIFASLGLACTTFFDYAFFIIIFPFGIYYGLKLFSQALKIQIAPADLLYMCRSGVTGTIILAEALIIGVTAAAFFMWRGIKNDIF